jgi:hypothetical protein
MKIARHKFKAQKVKKDGKVFDSKLEARFDNYLQLMQKSGKVIFYLSQVPIRLPGGTKYVVDFQVFNDDGTVEFIDTKGYETTEFKIKKREIEAIYPFEIKLIKHNDMRKLWQ